MLLWLHTHVSSVCFHVFQMFQTYVAKVDLNVVYVAMTIYACFKSLFRMFHLFQLYVANVLSLYFKSRLSVAYVAMHTSAW
jgi:hypothetical protein